MPNAQVSAPPGLVDDRHAHDRFLASPEVSRLLVDSIRDYAIFMLDPEGRVVTWNAGAEQLKGYRPDEIIGRHFSIFYPQADVVAGKPERELEIATREGAFEDEGWRLRKDGSRFFANVVITAIHDSSGNLRGFAKVTRDISVRWRTLQHLRSLTELAETSLAQLPLKERFENALTKVRQITGADISMVLLFDEKTDDLFLAAGNGLGLTALARERVSIGESLAGRVAAERRLMIAQDAAKDPRIRPSVRALGLQTILDIPLLAKDRLVGVLQIGFVSHRDLADDETDFIKLVADQLAMAIENSSLYEQARDANRIKDRFLSIASHELRTPLTAILGWLQMLREVDDPAIRVEGMQSIEASARTLAELITDMLDASRIREGKLVLNPVPVDLGSLAKASLTTATPYATHVGVKLALDLPPGAVVIEADPARIRQVLWNLLTNAIKFSPSGTTVTTRVSAEDGLATIAVNDEGEGISPDFLPFIFDELKQEEKGRAGGLGLGLYIVKTIVERHGGSIEARSEGRGRGASFIVRLPAKQSALISSAEPPVTIAVSSDSASAADTP